MRFQQSILVLAATLGLPFGVHSATTIPDGGYTVDLMEDGSQVWISFTDSSVEPVKIYPQQSHAPSNARSAKFSKRRTDCWGNPLDREGTDVTLNALRGWAGAGTTLTSEATPKAHGYKLNGVFSYYCITKPYSSGNLDLNDVNHAVDEMDKVCAPYTASWFGWDGSIEIVGKAPVGHTFVCTGPFN